MTSRRNIRGGAQVLHLRAPVNHIDRELLVTGHTNTWALGQHPMAAVIDEGTAFEEKVLVTGGDAERIHVVRAFDGTPGRRHNAGATVRHIIDFTVIDEMNRAMNLLEEVGDLLSFNGVSLDRVPATSVNGQFLMRDDTQPSKLGWRELIPVFETAIERDEFFGAVPGVPNQFATVAGVLCYWNGRRWTHVELPSMTVSAIEPENAGEGDIWIVPS